MNQRQRSLSSIEDPNNNELSTEITISPRANKKISILDRAKNKLRKIPERQPDYLTPLRQHRAKELELKKNKPSDTQYMEDVKIRARHLRFEDVKNAVFLSHLSNKGHIKDESK